MPDTKDMGSNVVIYGGKIYGPGVVTASTLPEFIMGLEFFEAYQGPDYWEDYDALEYEEPTTPPPTHYFP